MCAELIPVTKENCSTAWTLEATKEQVESCLILSVPDALKAASENPQKARPFFIKINGEIVGFTMFAFDETIEDINYRFWIWQFMIDKKFQGRGYAHLVLPEIIDYFKAENVKIITLSTKPENNNALSLYRKFGFKENGEMNDNEIILQKVLI